MKSDLSSKHCEACEGIGKALDTEQTKLLMHQLAPEWQFDSEHQKIHRAFSFKNFYETMAFMNALAFIANRENHHPDVSLGYNYCRVSFMTHALNGLTHNDFICAAKIDELVG
jgi:4a-hydroxytetrahydrobiopterin dehydratase